MKYKTMVIKMVVVAVIIISVSIYYGLQSQYFGKTLSGHIGGTSMFLALIFGLIALSEWYNSKTNK